MNFKLDVATLIGHRVSNVKDKIDSHHKCRFKDLTYLSMLVDSRNNEAMRHGVYLIFNDEHKCMYVGKCESTHFVDRLGFHFGMSPNYKHSFLSKYVESFGFNKDFDGYVKAVSTIENFKYLIIYRNNQKKKDIRTLEKLFMVMYQPYLNNLPKKVKAREFLDTDIFEVSLYK